MRWRSSTSLLAALGQFAILEDKEQPISFAAYAKEWLTTYTEVRCKPSSVREYEVVLSRYLNPIFGDNSLPTITREEVKRAVVTWMTGKASRTATLARARLYTILMLLLCLFVKGFNRFRARPFHVVTVAIGHLFQEGGNVWGRRKGQCLFDLAGHPCLSA
jgi:hypothetical protein